MQLSTMDIQATYAMAGTGLGYAVSNQINSNFADPSVRHLQIDSPELIEIGLAYNEPPTPAANAFLKFILDSDLTPPAIRTPLFLWQS